MFENETYDPSKEQWNLKLSFYSALGAIRFLKPQPGSTNPPGNGAEKKRALDPNFVPRWYAYVNDQEPEARIAVRPYKYRADIDSRHLYDIDLDPQHYRDQQKYSDATLLEYALYESEFSGYWSPARGVAVLFVDLPCDRVPHERDLFGEALDF